MTIYEVHLPDYQVSTEPDHSEIGKKVDEILKVNFSGQTLVIRGVSSSAHPDKTHEELIEIISSTGTDRYNHQRVGDRYENTQNKNIDLFAFRRKISLRSNIFKDISWGFYHGAKAIHGTPVRIDTVLLYDAALLKAVVHQYEGRDDVKRDGFIFKEPENKQEALLGIIKILN